MSLTSDMQARVVRALESVFDARIEHLAAAGQPGGSDVTVSISGHVLAIQIRARPSVNTIVAAARRASVQHRASAGAIQLLFVKHMPPAEGRKCIDLGLSWLDEGGNCDIRGPGLRVAVRGRPPAGGSPAGIATLWSPMSQRVMRYLVAHPVVASQRQIVRECGVDGGQVSRVIAQLIDLGAVQRVGHRELRTANGELLFDLLAASPVPEPVQRLLVDITENTDPPVLAVASQLDAAGLDYAITGMIALNLMLGHPVGSATGAIIVVGTTRQAILGLPRLRAANQGGVEILLSDDPTMLEGRTRTRSWWCASPNQLSLDLIAPRSAD